MKTKEKPKILVVRDVSPEAIAELKAKAAKEGLTMGKALDRAIEFWVHESAKKPKLSMAKFKAKSWGKGTERLSEEIDRIVYGGD